ncbi:tol-pal system protein YbgF [Falsirhodobacter sp. 20TX0035]|uniref:tol-pal system protein YbgF n=1 Tax=Falsirhodobacter sp. 20TX0035 TaxID=3022019 RepID=UPI00232F4721|nr:tol-pal system protein YbgF [Falsirhodobacter sp. 20TX0035]MDB6453881.1 tol-pal system protein YbgF [Falsirhodobacter sp. 20TX0035]
MRFALILTLALLPVSAFAQDRAQSLADIQAELSQLEAQFNSLKRELVSTGAINSGAAGGSALQRLDTIEASIQRLTGRTEEVELRLNRVVQQGTNQLGDLQFRVTELEGGDVGAIPPQATLGGEADTAPSAPAPSAPAAAAGTTSQLAVQEQADFDRAKGVLGQGDFQAAADQLEAFAQTYTGGPLTYEALYLRGEALSQLNRTQDAARSYLDAFSGDPEGPRAADALLRVGQRLGDLGQTQQACVTLAEVGNRFAGSNAATEAQTSATGLGCN